MVDVADAQNDNVMLSWTSAFASAFVDDKDVDVDVSVGFDVDVIIDIANNVTMSKNTFSRVKDICVSLR